MSCITPFVVKNKMTNQSIPVPCGKCPECLKRRTSGWSFRLMQEDKISIASHFITLTYDTKYVPITRNGFMTLDQSDPQKFMKRLRKEVSKVSDISVKYYLVGEYGGRTKRPHYHALIFNVESVRMIEMAWQLGSVHYGVVNGASVGYTLKYMNKRTTVPAHKNDDRLREFSLMSKGIGKGYLSPEIEKYHKADIYNRMNLTIEDGKKIAMPRYYKEKIYTEGQRKMIANYQKQEIEKREERIKCIYGKNYERDLVQSHLGLFRKQEVSSKKRDKL